MRRNHVSSSIFVTLLATLLAGTAAGQGVITTIAGSTFGACNYSGDGGQAIQATMCNPQDVAIDATGNIYFADSANRRIRKIDTNGIITTIAGNGVQGASGDGGPALSASLGNMNQVALDGLGRLCFGDSLAYKIRCVDLASGIITGYGTGNPGSAGDGGTINNASFYFPWGIAFSQRTVGQSVVADMYIGDFSDSIVRKVDGATGIITTIAGGPGNSALGDGGPATSAKLSFPAGLRYYNGSLYIGDSGNQRVRRVDLTSGIITTVAGNGDLMFTGDGGPATSAGLASPGQVDFDTSGNMYLSDRGHSRVRKVDTSGIINTVAGNGLSGIGPDNVPGPQTYFSGIHGVSWDSIGNRLLIVDGANRIRQIAATPTTTSVTSSSNPSTLGAAVTFTATVSPAAATGTVQFFAQNTSTMVIQNVGTATLAGGAAAVTTSDLSSGPANVWAVFSGNGSYASSTSPTLSQMIRFQSFTVLSSAPNPSLWGAAVTLTANIYPNSGQTGTVNFLDGGNVIGTVALTGGQAQLVTSALVPGSHVLTAAYSGETWWSNSTSTPVTQNVNQTATATSLTSAPSPSAYGASVTLTATVSPSTATGVVQFFGNGTLIGSANLSGGQASMTTTALPAGTNQLTAIYSGNAPYAASTSSIRNHTVNKANTTTSLSVTPSSPRVGQTVTMTATVAPAAATGTVQFRAGSVTIGTVTLSGGTAVFTTNTLTQGNHSIRAVYSGDTNFNGSQSSQITVRVKR